MRSRILPAVGLSAVALVAATAFAGQATAAKSPAAASAARTSHVTYPAKACYSQGTNLDGYGISSQNFEASLDAYDDQAADDFTVKKSCSISTVDVSGFYNGAGGVTTANVFFYKNSKGKPAKKALKTFNNAKASDDGTGNLTISLGKKGEKLSKGTYWVSVQANLDYSSGGQWYWADATDGSGADAMWQNPGGGFGVCPKWGDVITCNTATDANLSFSLS
jgi:hypothetical protein